MTAPRPFVRGTTYLVTRRCTQRQFLLQPSAVVDQIFLYCLAVAAERSGVDLHAVVVMSNHYHCVITDRDGRAPEFYGWLHEFVARAVNAHRGRWENLWATEPTSCVRLVEPDDVLDKVVYTLTNPVAAGLVQHGHQWPGVRLCGPVTRTIARPVGFFRNKGRMPESATLVLTAPAVGSDAAAALARLDAAVRATEEQIRARMVAEGRRFLGRRAVLAQHWSDSPTSAEPRRALSPRVACKSKWHRIEALQRLVHFVAAYRDALARWRAGLRDALFPAGTYWMARLHDVAVAET